MSLPPQTVRASRSEPQLSLRGPDDGDIDGETVAGSWQDAESEEFEYSVDEEMPEGDPFESSHDGRRSLQLSLPSPLTTIPEGEASTPDPTPTPNVRRASRRISQLVDQSLPVNRRISQLLDDIPTATANRRLSQLSIEAPPASRRFSPLPDETPPANRRLSQLIGEGRRDQRRASVISNASTNATQDSAAGPMRPIKRFIGPWHLGVTLGKGASSRVRRAKHAVTGLPAAVKILSKREASMNRTESMTNLQHSMQSPTWAERSDRVPFSIDREVAILKLISHANIVKCYDVWENRGEM